MIDRSLQPAGLGYRPELGVIDRSYHPPTLDIDRSSALSTYGCTRRPRISTGAPRYRPMAPPADPGYRPELRVIDLRLPTRRPWISTGAWRYRPKAPPAGPRYRPELRVIDLSLRPPAPDIDRSSALSTHGSARRPWISTGAWRYRPMAPPADPGYRPELRVIDLWLHPPAPDIDRSSALSTYGSARRPRISTGAPRYRPMAPHPPALDIDRSLALSTGAPSVSPLLDPKRLPDSQPGVRKSGCLPTAQSGCLPTRTSHQGTPVRKCSCLPTAWKFVSLDARNSSPRPHATRST